MRRTRGSRSGAVSILSVISLFFPAQIGTALLFLDLVGWPRFSSLGWAKMRRLVSWGSLGSYTSLKCVPRRRAAAAGRRSPKGHGPHPPGSSARQRAHGGAQAPLPYRWSSRCQLAGTPNRGCPLAALAAVRPSCPRPGPRCPARVSPVRVGARCRITPRTSARPASPRPRPTGPA